MSLGRMTITEQGLKEKCLPQRLTGNRCSFPQRVPAAIRPWTTWARSATTGRLLGSRPSTRGTCASILGISAWTTTDAAMGCRCEGYSNNKINYIYNKLDENPAFVVYINI